MRLLLTAPFTGLACRRRGCTSTTHPSRSKCKWLTTLSVMIKTASDDNAFQPAAVAWWQLLQACRHE